ncbi:carboxylesterase 4A isoform X1 [Peromyscus californicus insignis]|uniref:carboxylesterase 4A isoform X1 n=1 Tax=Peromyscus californicus insignis TaxID=564181 RepID=UPI0022A77908|nr:carboxylesterase 4A isoform X1 [Peromyscus californicus insignis]
MAEAEWSMKWILGLSLTLCLVVQTALGALHTKEPLVVTKHGILQGKQTHVGNITVQVFLGVPFSRPPVGARRFAPPEPPQPWNGIRDATTYPPSCLQETWGQITSIYLNTRKRYKWLHFSEDCLYLNVYAPVLASGDPLLPVMVWFPGGAFLVGSASTYEGSELAAREKVVLVFLQYRLGILGFFSTGDSQARGNWGMLDQVAALHWVQENIEAFGGDPDSVTLFGQSAGAMSVSGLLMSPLAQGLFHRAISQSGTAILKSFITHDPLKAAKKVAHMAGCNHNNTRIMVECLRALSGDEVMHVSKRMSFFHANFKKDPKDIVWFLSPVVDGVVFPEDPVVLLTHGQVTPVPYLLGVNNVEFEWALPFLMKLQITRHMMNKKYFTKLLWSFSTLLNITKEQIPLVVKEYLNDAANKHDWTTFRNRVIDLVGDATFVYSTLQAARYHRDAGFPVYLYEFKHHAPSGIIVKPRHDGADHGDELSYIFGSPFSKGSSTNEEKELSLQMMKYWANFARTGDPNHRKLPYWPRFDEDEKYLQLDFDTRVGVKLKEKKMAFWGRLHQPQRT